MTTHAVAQVVMTPDIARTLREPFPAESVGKLPRVFCKACRDAQFKVCQQHSKARCRDCGNNITTAHLHLDYVGHAEITDRLLQADATWTWEPVSFGPDGLPLLDRNGGLWIRLTVAGVTRLGYGHADGKSGPDAIKEAIGDALRNSAMRFGVALDLWGAKFKDGTEDHPDDEPNGEQSETCDAFRKAIDLARNGARLKSIGADVVSAKAQGAITPFQYEQLAKRAAARIAELGSDTTKPEESA